MFICKVFQKAFRKAFATPFVKLAAARHRRMPGDHCWLTKGFCKRHCVEDRSGKARYTKHLRYTKYIKRIKYKELHIYIYIYKIIYIYMY